jgi:hypothetical protein
MIWLDYMPKLETIKITKDSEESSQRTGSIIMLGIGMDTIIGKFPLGLYVAHFTNITRSVGAFAYFGPGQFQHLYPFITGSDGKYLMCGEAASAHHAWVVGALESATRAMYQFLFKHSKKNAAASDAASAFANDKIPMPWGPIPPEYDRTEVMKTPALNNNLEVTIESSPLGDLARQQVCIESLRLKQDKERLDFDEVQPDDLYVKAITELLGKI